MEGWISAWIVESEIFCYIRVIVINISVWLLLPYFLSWLLFSSTPLFDFARLLA